MTAEEYLNNRVDSLKESEEVSITDLMIEFAKYHVEQVLKEITIKAEVEIIGEGETLEGDIFPVYGINSKSILNAYPLDLIK